MLQNINCFTIIYTFIEKIKPKEWGKSQKEGEGKEWVNGILAIPAPTSAPYKHTVASQKASLQAKNGRALQDIAKKGYTWESPRRKNWGMQATRVRCADGSIQGYSGEVC